MTVTVVAREPATYRASALFSALARMWSAAAPALVFILVNALVQAALTYLDVQSGAAPAFLLSLLVSALSALVLYGVLSASALQAVDGAGGFNPVLRRFRAHLTNFTGWTLIQWLLVVLAVVVQPLLVLLVAALTPFLPLAAMDGRRFAIGANLATIGHRFGRWLVTSALMAIGGVLFYVMAALNTFFVKGTPASLAVWVAIGLVAWWWLTAWALIFRRDSGPVSAVPDME